MASFEDHLVQAKSNLTFLQKINEHSIGHWDWQVTTCFYTAVHILHAHIARVGNLHYESHTEIFSAINPTKSDNLFAVTPECFKAYRSLFNLSIRSRYLTLHSEDKLNSNNVLVLQHTNDKHMIKAIKQLDTIMSYVSSAYSISFQNIQLNSPELSGVSFKFFKSKQNKS